MNRHVPRAEVERFTATLAEKRRRLAKAEQSTRGYRDGDGVWQGGLLSFVQYYWHILEPGTELVLGFPIEAICEHLEAVTFGEITNLLITVFPGAMKSLLTDVFWPAWEHGPMNMPHIRYVAFSYSSTLTERDNLKFRDLMASSEYKEMYPHVKLRQEGARKVSNTSHGWKLASSVGGVGTGERGDRIICFPSWQIVQTEIGPLPIGDIVEKRMALRVPSLDTGTGEVSMQPITAWHRNLGSDLVKITLSDGSFVHCTPHHRFWDGRGWIEAINLRSGAVLPIALEAQPVCDAGPCTTDADCLDRGPLYAVSGRKDISGIGGIFSDLCGLILGKNSPSSRNQERPMLERIVNVVLPRAVLQIAASAIKGISVFVSDLFAFRARAKESLCHYPMNQDGEGLPVLSKIGSWVASRCEAFHDFTGIHHFMGALDVALPIAVVGHSAFADDYAREAFNPPHTGDFVGAFKAHDWSPFLVVESVVYDGQVDCSYCLTVESNHTFYVGSGKALCASNCDDGHNIKESESETVRNETIRWFRESMSSRLNNMETGAKIVIMQRVNEADIAGTILSLNLPYCHLSIDMEYTWQADDDGNPYTTDIGWVDPRWKPNKEDCEGELAWPTRFPEDVIQRIKTEVGPYGWACQYQQVPAPRGGGLIKTDWWEVAEKYMNGGKFPPFSYVIASLDGAYTDKEQNDPSALTVWGIFENEHGYNRAMLIHAWKKRLEFSGSRIDIEPGEHESVYRRRSMPHWGLIEWVADTCNRFKADRLLIEAKASGISAAQSLRNSHGKQGWGIELIDPKGDKVARVMAIIPSFSQGMIYAPDREWADETIKDCGLFPYGSEDDLVDSTSQALKHMRDNGLIRSDEERRAEEIDAVRHKGPAKRITYPGMRRLA